VLGAVGLFLAWSATATYLLLGARSDLEAGAASLRRVRSGASVAALARPPTARRLRSAGSRFRRASSRLDNPFLTPLRLVPVASRHIEASRELAHASSDGVDVADEALAGVRDVVARPHRTGAQRIALLHRLVGVAENSQQRLAGIRVRADGPLLPQLADAVDELRAQQLQAMEGADHLAMVSAAVAEVLDGPKPYLVLGANNAEMRDGSGMFLSAATLALHRGQLELGPVRPTEEIVLPPETGPVEPELAANFPWLDTGRDLRNLALTANFPQSAKVAAANWAATPGGEPVAGVISLDVDAIRSLLRVVGPLEVGGIRYTSDSARSELLRSQYRRTPQDREARRDQLGQVARAVFERLQQGRWKVDELATELVDAVQGRHLLVWSSDPNVQRAWRDARADGHLTSSTVSVGLVNRSATKVDSWVGTTVALRTERNAREGTRLTIRYQVQDGSPAEGPKYLVGPNIDGLAAGDVRSLVMANLPAGSTRMTVQGARKFLNGGDGPTHVLGADLIVRRGQTATVTITADLPPGLRQLELEPSARIPGTKWSLNGTNLGRDRRRTVEIP